MTESQNAIELAQRLDRLIGRIGALNDCVHVVNRALEDEAGLELVRTWLEQALSEMKTEEKLILLEVDAKRGPSA